MFNLSFRLALLLALIGCMPAFAQVKWQSATPIKNFQEIDASPLHVVHTNATYDASGAFLHIQVFNQDMQALEPQKIKTDKIVVPGKIYGNASSTLVTCEDGKNPRLTVLDPAGNIIKTKKLENLEKVQAIGALANSYWAIHPVKVEKLKGFELVLIDNELKTSTKSNVLPQVKGKLSFYSAASSDQHIRMVFKDKKADKSMRIAGFNETGELDFNIGLPDFDPLRITAFKVLEDGSSALAVEDYKGTAGKSTPISTIIFHISSDGSTVNQYPIQYGKDGFIIEEHSNSIISNSTEMDKAIQIFDFSLNKGKLMAWGNAYHFNELKPASSNSNMPAMATSADYFAFDAYVIQCKQEGIDIKRVSKPFSQFTVNNMTSPTNDQVLEVMNEQHASQMIAFDDEAVFIGQIHGFNYIGSISPEYQYENLAKRRYFGDHKGSSGQYTRMQLNRESSLTKYLDVYQRGLCKMGDNAVLYFFDVETNLLTLSLIQP